MVVSIAPPGCACIAVSLAHIFQILGKVCKMDLLEVLRGEEGTVTGEQASALSCAGLVTQWPDQVLRLGPVAHQGLLDPNDNWLPSAVHKCGTPGSALHEEAHSIARAIQAQERSHPLLVWWGNILAGSSATAIARRQLPVVIDNRNLVSISNSERSSRSALAINLLNQELEHLVLLDDATPEGGPAVWTMTYILMHEIGLAGLPLEGDAGLIQRTNEYLEKPYEISYLYALALNGPFLVSESIDGRKHINIDFSGLGGPNPQQRGWNLSSTPGLMRGDECWYWKIDNISEEVDSSDVPFSLSIHLAILALRRASAASVDKQAGLGHAVVVVGERKGWLYTQGLKVQGKAKGPGDAWLEISDNGVLAYRFATSLSDLVPSLPSPANDAEFGLRAASSLLGINSGDSADVPDPRLLRARIRLRGDQNLQLIRELFHYINSCAQLL
jgi:hypothetical protein